MPVDTVDFRAAEEIHAEQIAALVERTVREIYPQYYRQEIVDAFCRLHGADAVLEDHQPGETVHAGQRSRGRDAGGHPAPRTAREGGNNMKQLMLGNAAVARGLYEAGCCVISSYPGTPSTEITEEAVKYPELYCEWAPNEKVAMEVAFGACLAGKRAFCAMKHVGLNVAADPLYTMAYTGVNAGLVIGVADDPGMHSSQNEQDSRHYARAAKLPMLEPSDSAEALEFTKLAYDLSENFDTPVIMKMCTRVAHSQSVVEPGERVAPARKPYEKNGAKYIMMPGNAKRRHPVVEERLRKIAEWAETASVNRVEPGKDRKMGIITSSTSYQYVKEACGDTYPVLKLGMVWPLPERKITEFAGSVDLLVVVEELDSFIESFCRSLGLACTGKSSFPCVGELSQNTVAEQLTHEKRRITNF